MYSIHKITLHPTVDFAAEVDGAELVITKARDGLAVMQYSIGDELRAFLQDAGLKSDRRCLACSG